MKCPDCGYEIDVPARFCPECGCKQKEHGADLHIFKAYVAEHKGDIEEAIEHYKYALKHDPTRPEVL